LRKFSAIAGLLILLLPMPSRSESTSGAMSAFGIVGSWSPDCAGSVRLTYSTPFFGTPTITIERDGKQQLVAEVQEAVRVSEEKLKFTVRVEKRATSDVTPMQFKALPQPGEVWEIVYVKVGNKFRTYSSKERDGDKVLVKNGVQYIAKDDAHGGFSMENSGKLTPLNERCLS
jgi:hypothetical protein